MSLLKNNIIDNMPHVNDEPPPKLSQYWVAFTLVCPFTLEPKHNVSRVIEAESPELAVILARNDVMYSDGAWGKAIDIKWHLL